MLIVKVSGLRGGAGGGVIHALQDEDQIVRWEISILSLGF